MAIHSLGENITGEIQMHLTTIVGKALVVMIARMKKYTI